MLLNSAISFCTSFASHSPAAEILSHFSASEDTFALEHGHPALGLPFLGRPFRGPDGIKTYFALISSLLSYDAMRFVDYVVDADASTVAARGEARFTWIETGQSWDEVFAYALGFDEQGKVKTYEVWADSGAAYLASRGELNG